MSRIASLIFKRSKIFVLPWLTFVAILTGSQCSPPIIPMLLTVTALFMISTCVYVYNDVTDVEMDRLNPHKRDRPLPSGRVTTKEAMRLIYFTGVTGLVLSALVNVETFLLCTVFMTLYLVYSMPRVRLKKMFILKEGTIATGNFLSCLIGGVAIGSVSMSIIFLGLFLFAYAFIGSPIDEYFDMEEDAKYGCKTIPMVLPWKKIVQLYMSFLVIVMITMPLTYQHLGFNMIFPIITVLSCGLSLYLFYPLLKNKPEKQLSARKMISIYIPWITTHIAVIIGTLPI